MKKIFFERIAPKRDNRILIGIFVFSLFITLGLGLIVEEVWPNNFSQLTHDAMSSTKDSSKFFTFYISIFSFGFFVLASLSLFRFISTGVVWKITEGDASIVVETLGFYNNVRNIKISDLNKVNIYGSKLFIKLKSGENIEVVLGQPNELEELKQLIQGFISESQ